MGDLEFKLNSTDIHQNSEITGTIDVSYPGRYDGVVVNTTILDSNEHIICLLYTSPSPRDRQKSRMPSSA